MLARFLLMALPPVLMCTTALQLAHADIYRWTDASGRVNVSNLPPPEGARVSHLVHEAPPPVAARTDSARDAAKQAALRALSERVQQLEAEANVARNAVPPDLTYARIPAPPPPPVQYNVTVVPAAPQYNAEPPPQQNLSCDPTWAGCAPWWGTYFYPVPALVSRAPNVHRFPPFRGPHPFHGPQHVNGHQPLARMPGTFRKG